jgi:hypothetical protein
MEALAFFFYSCVFIAALLPYRQFCLNQSTTDLQIEISFESFVQTVRRAFCCSIGPAFREWRIQASIDAATIPEAGG